MTHLQVVAKDWNYARDPMSQCSYARIYILSSIDNAEVLTVWWTFFKLTVQVSARKTDLTIKKTQDSGEPVSDKSGWHQTHNKTHPDDTTHMISSMNSMHIILITAEKVTVANSACHLVQISVNYTDFTKNKTKKWHASQHSVIYSGHFNLSLHVLEWKYSFSKGSGEMLLPLKAHLCKQNIWICAVTAVGVKIQT